MTQLAITDQKLLAISFEYWLSFVIRPYTAIMIKFWFNLLHKKL